MTTPSANTNASNDASSVEERKSQLFRPEVYSKFGARSEGAVAHLQLPSQSNQGQHLGTVAPRNACGTRGHGRLLPRVGVAR